MPRGAWLTLNQLYIMFLIQLSSACPGCSAYCFCGSVLKKDTLRIVKPLQRVLHKIYRLGVVGLLVAVHVEL